MESAGGLYSQLGSLSQGLLKFAEVAAVHEKFSRAEADQGAIFHPADHFHFQSEIHRFRFGGIRVHGLPPIYSLVSTELSKAARIRCVETRKNASDRGIRTCSLGPRRPASMESTMPRFPGGRLALGQLVTASSDNPSKRGAEKCASSRQIRSGFNEQNQSKFLYRCGELS